MSDTLVITRQATLMADWSCYVDDVLHQDPEIAFQQGYLGTTMPEGALSVAAVQPELIDLDLLRAGRLRRDWVGHTPAQQGQQLSVSVEKDAGAVTTTFIADGGVLVAVEHLEEVEPLVRTDETGGPTAFRTGPIDGSRIHALLWSIGCLRGEPDWKWGGEPVALVERAVGLLLPSIVAGRAATGPARWAHRVQRITCQPTGSPPREGGIVEASSTVGGNVRLTVGGVEVAHTRVTLTEAAPRGR